VECNVVKVTDISGVRVTPLWHDALLGVTLNALIVLAKLVRIGQYNKFIKIHLAIGYDYLEPVFVGFDSTKLQKACAKT
jgi:hypothetical protein